MESTLTLFGRLRKKRAIQSYIQRLPRLLRTDYGPSKSYTPAQVIRTIERSGLSSEYSRFALAIFSDPTDFDSYHEILGEDCSYMDLRSEMASDYLGGQVNFLPPSAAETSICGFYNLHHAGSDVHGCSGSEH